MNGLVWVAVTRTHRDPSLCTLNFDMRVRSDGTVLAHAQM